MSEMAKAARAAMKAKAKSITTADPHQKVDSSTWSPSEPINAEVKTGARPISRRAFKAGGKVVGEEAKARMDRKPRKSGGRALSANSLINRDVKEANDEREGIKHVGAFKRGGKVKKADGGALDRLMNNSQRSPDYTPKRDENYQHPTQSAEDKKALNEKFNEAAEGRKRGGKVKKAEGGFMDPRSAAQDALNASAARSGVPASRMSSSPTTSKLARSAGLKKGGAAKHDDEAMDKALIKKMVKPSARTARKSGGKVGKGRTNINIVIAGGKPQDGGPQVPGGMPPGRPPVMPVPAGAPGAGAPPMMGPGAGAPPAPPMMPPQAPPMMGRKAGGRVYRSYKDMDAGAGSGLGRLEKTEIQARAPRKAGGKVYRSYKDMDAGAGSGEGRLEKTEIQRRK